MPENAALKSKDTQTSVPESTGQIETLSETAGVQALPGSARLKPTVRPPLTPANVIALQRTIGNQAVMRLLAKSPARTYNTGAAPVQRALTLPNTEAFYDMLGFGEKNSGDNDLPKAAQTLLDAVNKAVTTDIDAGPIKQTMDAYKPDQLKVLVTQKIEPMWNLTAAGKSEDKRKNTVRYHLVQTLWNEMAEYTARRIKTDTTEEIVKIKKEMANDAIVEGKSTVDASSASAGLKEYKKLKFEVYQNQIKKQEELAASITHKVAYKIAKAHIRPKHPLIEQIIAQKDTHLTAIAEPIMESLEKEYAKRIGEPVASLKRKQARISNLLTDINAKTNKTWGVSKPYPVRLQEEFHKLQKKDYQKNLIAEIAEHTKALDATAHIAVNNSVGKFKKEAGEELLAKFRAGSKNLKHADNTENRRNLKTAIVSQTQKVLSHDPQKLDIRDGMGKKQTVDPQNILDKARTKTVKETIEGPVHSRLGKLAKVIGPMFAMDGDKGKVEFLLKVPVGDPGGGGYVGMRFTGQIEHDVEWDEEKKDDHTFMVAKKDKDTGDKKVKADTFKIKADLAVTGGYRVPFVADIGGELGGYLEVESDKGLERAMELISFGFYRRFRESTLMPGFVTDQLWGLGGGSAGKGASFGKKSDAKNKEAKAWGKAFQESLSDKEFIENGAFGAVTGSASISELATFKGSLRGFAGKRYAKQTMAALEEHKANKKTKLTAINSSREHNLGRNMFGSELSFEFGVGPFVFSGKVKGTGMENQAGNNLDEKLSKKLTKLDANDPDPAVVAQIKKIKQARRLLERQLYSIETEGFAASRGGSFANALMTTSQVMSWAAAAGSHVRSAVVSYKGQYGEDKKGQNATSGMFASAMTGIEAGVNHINGYDPSTAADKLQSNMHVIGSQMDKSLPQAAADPTALAKMDQFLVKGAGGLKFTIKHSTKRDFASADEGARTSKDYPTKVEFIFDAVGGLTLGSQVAVATIEKSTRLFRLGFKYKDGNTHLMTK